MPIYELVCENCGAKIELYCSYEHLLKEKEKICERCKEKKLKLSLNKPNLIGVN